MNLLLLLSAMLSALTGIGNSTRAVEATAAITTNVSIAPTAGRAVTKPSSRPIQAFPAVGDLSALTTVDATPLRAREPLYASRRRE